MRYRRMVGCIPDAILQARLTVLAAGCACHLTLPATSTSSIPLIVAQPRTSYQIDTFYTATTLRFADLGCSDGHGTLCCNKRLRSQCRMCPRDVLTNVLPVPANAARTPPVRQHWLYSSLPHVGRDAWPFVPPCRYMTTDTPRMTCLRFPRLPNATLPSMPWFAVLHLPLHCSAAGLVVGLTRSVLCRNQTQLNILGWHWDHHT